MKVVVDTSIIVDFLRRQTDSDSYYIQLKQKEVVVISLITVAELYSGRSAYEAKQNQYIQNIVHTAEVVIPTQETAKMAGRLRLDYSLSLADAFIAALALDLNVPLATLNVRDLKQIDGLKMLPQKLK
mgnify:CR=1 FL=1